MTVLVFYVWGNSNDMRTLHRELHHVHALLAFEAAARHRNFTLAARELHLTRVAISRQIKLLEDDLGVVLFHRQHRGVTLTPEGEDLYATVSAGFQKIAATQRRLRTRGRHTRVNVSITVSFATFWLLPRLGAFREQHPELDLRLIVSDKYLNLREEGIDVAIRWGNVNTAGYTVQSLFPGAVIPICSPAYAQQHQPLGSPADLLEARLIHLEGSYRPQAKWPNWFAHFGLSLPAEPRGIFVDSYTSMVQAAMAGEGVGLGDTPFLDHLVDEGSLVWPLDVPPVERETFYLVENITTPVNTAARAFCEWLLAQVAILKAAPIHPPLSPESP